METAFTQQIAQETTQVIQELLNLAPLKQNQILVLGVSTSEILGERIGSFGSEEVAFAVFQAVKKAQQIHGFHLAFQCCEHLNRALVVEQETVKQFSLDEVTVIPAPKAGGAMAATAFKRLAQPAIVEYIKADAGIDIGDTFIGMHLKHVAVPLRTKQKKVGEAHVTMAKTRPKLIGGARAIYMIEKE
jgi:uncharacterized protein (TIGR01440 family)